MGVVSVFLLDGRILLQIFIELKLFYASIIGYS